MGGIYFYKKIVSHFSQLACPLHNLANQPRFVWSQEADWYFTQLNKALCSTPIFKLLDLLQPFEIKTDASIFSIGVVLK